MFKPTDNEQARLVEGIRTALAVPFIDDLEDYVWEVVFAHMKGINPVDPLENIRSKKLFDVIDPVTKIGWSAKALQWTIYPSCEFELVIQRADIFKKSTALGFERLTLETYTQTLGAALLAHWYNKVRDDSIAQKVADKRICILLKSRNRRQFAYYEDVIAEYSVDELDWRWTDDNRTGLQGIRRSDDFCVFRWYPNQKQLFERFRLADDADIFSINIRRLPLEATIKLLLSVLDKP